MHPEVNLPCSIASDKFETSTAEERECSSPKRRAVASIDQTNGHLLVQVHQPNAVGYFHQQKIYGKLFILGFNGFIPPKNRGRLRSKFTLSKRYNACGAKFKESVTVSNPSFLMRELAMQRIVGYIFSPDRSIAALYSRDAATDMFQIGRSAEGTIDFVVLDTARVAGRTDYCTVSRFACRITADRTNCSDVRVFAGGFNEDKCIIIGEKAVKWQDGKEIDGLTTNGIMVSHPVGEYWGGEAKPGFWREVSICGKLYTHRLSRKSQRRGKFLPDETNMLKDGSLIDLCGAVLLWRSREGLEKSLTKAELLSMFEKYGNSAQKFCRGVVPQKKEKVSYVYVDCGHIQNGLITKNTSAKCPVCLKCSSILKLCAGLEPAFYVDRGPPCYAFNPCGHVANWKTVMYWSSVKVLNMHDDFEPICPFCATPLDKIKSYIHLE